MPGLCGALPPEQAEPCGRPTGSRAPRRRGRLGRRRALDPLGPGAAGRPAAGRPGRRSGRAGPAAAQLLHDVVNTTHQTFEDNDVTNIDDRDTTVDNSVNQDITAFGDVNQDFDNDVVSGDGAVAAGDDAQVNTGDGAVQAGDDIEDSTVATGDVEGSVVGRRHQRLGGRRRQPGHLRLDRRGRQLRRGRRHQRRGRERQLWATARSSTAPAATSPSTRATATSPRSTTRTSASRSWATARSSRTTSTSTPTRAARSPSATGQSTAETQDVDVSGNSGTVQVADDATQTGLTDNSINDSYNTTSRLVQHRRRRDRQLDQRQLRRPTASTSTTRRGRQHGQSPTTASTPRTTTGIDIAGSLAPRSGAPGRPRPVRADLR